MKILVTAGPTRERLDPVRYISNRSTGKMGYAVACAARDAGHEVTLVSGPVALAAPEGVSLVRVESAAEMAAAVFDAFPRQDLVVMAAAVADYRPAETADHKIKKQKGDLLIRLERTTDILAELGEAVCIYEETAKQAGVSLIYHEPASLPVIVGDSDRLTQVFVNIIDNAIKYNHEGGVVQIRAVAEDNCVKITVTDSGVGIPAADLDKVKEKFYKANYSVRGSGIGLAVADEIVRSHQGLLTVESSEGIGTTVTVALPVAEHASLEQTEESGDEHGT